MKLRVPYWATEGFEVQVNGETICTKPEVSTYVEINRTWKSGDVVTINMPYTLHLDKTPDKVDGSTVASLMYGPLVMVAKDDRDTYVPMNWYTVVLSENLSDTVKVVTGTDEDEVPHLTTNGLDFYPMYDAYNYRYHAYVKVEDMKSVVNKDELQALVDSVTAGENVPDKNDYNDTQWSALQQAIADAQAVLDNADATQTEVYNAYKTLQAALDDKTEKPDPEKPDKSELQEAVDNAVKESEKDKYTEESWKAYQDALAHANEVLADEGATEKDIADALNGLQSAYDALEAVSEEPDDQDKPGTGDSDDQDKPGTADPDKDGSGQNKPDADSSAGGSSDFDKAVQTGDTTPVGIMVMLLAASVAAGGTVVYRKKRS